MMDQLIARFPDQLKEAIKISSKVELGINDPLINHVYVTGMGGSGIGGDFVSSFIRDECRIPYLVGKSYSIPAFIGNGSLAIISSYSGNTEETISAFSQIEQTGARIIIISSGGKLIEIANKKGYDYIQIPGNWPSPRACIGYSIVAQLSILQKLDLISPFSLSEMERSIELIIEQSEEIQTKASHIANYLFQKIPVIYIEDRMSPVAVRWRQQFNENAKALCWNHTFPEMNHNELVGWRDRKTDLAAVFLRNRDDYSRNVHRINITKEIVAECTDTIIEVYSKGGSMIQRAMYLIHLGDWVSWHLSALRKQDSLEVHVIDFLKSELAKIES